MIPSRQTLQQQKQRKYHRSSSSRQCSIFVTMLFSLILLMLQLQPSICQQQQQQQQQQRQVQQDDDVLPVLLAFDTEPFTPNVSHRQDVCSRYDGFRNGSLELRNALEGLELRPIIRLNQYFNYDSETGIDPDDPGLMGALLDELAKRAGFTWRDSFAILDRPAEKVVNNVTWTFTDLLVWSVDAYDISINWWDQSVERMERGVAYIEPWFDGSVILIDQADPPKEAHINLFNWLRPFQRGVWFLTVLTIVVSGCVHQLIEYLDDEGNERSFLQWFMDSTYLSWLNVTQNYEYAPNTVSGRIFGISMGIWALVMTATYTANLASLLVEERVAPTIVDSIDEAIVLGIPICTYANTNADSIIKKRYKDAIRIPKPSELEAYEALRRGECGLVAGYKDNWLGFRTDSRYNPECDLEWVGRTVEVIKSGFATKADAGHLCSSLIRDVFNLHLTEIIGDEFLLQAWEVHRATAAGDYTIDCVTGTTEDEESSTRFLRAHEQEYSSPVSEHIDDSSHYHRPSNVFGTRKLKGGGGGNSAAANSDGVVGEEGERLTVQQMAGVFALHFVTISVAVMISAINRYLRIREQKKAAAAAQKCKETGDCSDKRAQFAATSRRVSFRGHGPIIGSAPPVNTYVQNRPRMVDLSRFQRRSTDITTQEEGSDENESQAFYCSEPMTVGGTNTTTESIRRSCRDLHVHSTALVYDKKDDRTDTTSTGDAMMNPFYMSNGGSFPEHFFHDLRKDVSETQHELKNSHTELRLNQLELCRQMNAMMTMMQEMYKNTNGGGMMTSTSGDNGFETLILYNDTLEGAAALSTSRSDDEDKDHRD